MGKHVRGLGRRYIYIILLEDPEMMNGKRCVKNMQFNNMPPFIFRTTKMSK